MIIYRNLAIHQQWQQLVSLLSEIHNLLAVIYNGVKDR